MDMEIRQMNSESIWSMWTKNAQARKRISVQTQFSCSFLKLECPGWQKVLIPEL